MKNSIIQLRVQEEKIELLFETASWGVKVNGVCYLNTTDTSFKVPNAKGDLVILKKLDIILMSDFIKLFSFKNEYKRSFDPIFYKDFRLKYFEAFSWEQLFATEGRRDYFLYLVRHQLLYISHSYCEFLTLDEDPKKKPLNVLNIEKEIFRVTLTKRKEILWFNFIEKQEKKWNYSSIKKFKKKTRVGRSTRKRVLSIELRKEKGIYFSSENLFEYKCRLEGSKHIFTRIFNIFCNKRKKLIKVLHDKVLLRNRTLLKTSTLIYKVSNRFWSKIQLDAWNLCLLSTHHYLRYHSFGHIANKYIKDSSAFKHCNGKKYVEIVGTYYHDILSGHNFELVKEEPSLYILPKDWHGDINKKEEVIEDKEDSYIEINGFMYKKNYDCKEIEEEIRKANLPVVKKLPKKLIKIYRMLELNRKDPFRIPNSGYWIEESFDWCF